MEPGLIAGRYQVIRAVGRGGMGTVWLCRDEVLHRDVAVKQIRTLPGEESVNAVRALREARLSAAVSHENAVSLYDIVNHEGSPWLVMEYVPSRTLAEVVKETGPLDVSRVIRIGAQLAAALASAHALGIIHRDIKPGNVLIGSNDVAKISDFGIARGHKDERLTLTGLVTGTPSYFSPELARGGEPSQASDVWALGATLYYAVEGRPPYEGSANPLAMLARIASERPPPVERAGVLADALSTMLDPNPTTRASMPAVLVALRRLGGAAKDASAARAAQRDRAYTETTLSEQPVGMLGAMLEHSEPSSRDRYEAARERSPGPPPAAVGATSVESPDPRRARRPSFALLSLGLVVALLLALGGALVWSSLTSPETNEQSDAPGAGTKEPRTSPGTTPVHSPTGSTGSNPGSSTTSPSTATPPTTPPSSSLPASSTPPSSSPPSSSPPSSAPPPAQSAQAMVNFVTSYFNTVPGNTDTGWSELAPSMQQRVTRASYDNFWNSIDSVDVADVRAVPGTLAVEYTITYHVSDGRDSLEHKRIDLVPHGSGYWIASDGPAS